MKKKSLVGILIFSLLLGLIITGCESDAYVQNGDMLHKALKEPSTKMDKDQREKLIKQFNDIVNSDNEPYTLIQFVDEHIKDASEEEAVVMILLLEEVQEKYIQIYTDELFMEDNQMELLKLSGSEQFFRESKIEEIKNANLKELVEKIVNGKYKMINMEGAFYPTIDYEALKVYADYLPDDLKDYIEIKSSDSNRPVILDAEITVPFEELAERVVKVENYLKQHPESIKREEVLRIYGHYLRLYLEGSANTPIYDYETNKIKEEILSNYNNIIKDKELVTSDIISQYIDIIEQNQNIIDDNVFSKVPGLHSEAIAILENIK